MDPYLEFAKGPLFAVTFGIMVLGLARHVILQTWLLLSKGRTLSRVRWRTVASDTLSWVLPFRHMVRGAVFLTFTSILFHIGVILVPLFLADHAVLWDAWLGTRLPALNKDMADALSLTTIFSVSVLFLYRLLVRRSHDLSRFSDYLLLVLVFLPFASGFLAAHPAWNPLPWTSMMLIHVLSAEALFLAVPFTKLAHVVLFPFDRLSQVHWQLKPGAGEQVADALFGKEARV